MTFELQRSNLGETKGGVFTIGEINSNFSDVIHAPNLTVIAATGEWLTFMDGATINGKNFTGGGLLCVAFSSPLEA